MHDTLEGVVMEDWEECKNCGYLYGYAYGSYEVKIGDKFWTWNYNTDWQIVNRLEEEIKSEMEKELRRLQNV
jgi:hypothetical protein